MPNNWRHIAASGEHRPVSTRYFPLCVVISVLIPVMHKQPVLGMFVKVA
jgi:hypothetical protein